MPEIKHLQVRLPMDLYEKLVAAVEKFNHENLGKLSLNSFTLEAIRRMVEEIEKK